MQATKDRPATVGDRYRLSPEALERMGVRKLNKYGLVLGCEKCGAEWSPQPGEDGSLPRGFWQCPNRCNW